MQALKKQLKETLPLILVSVFAAYNPVMAATDLTAQENFLKARVMSHQQEIDHTAHLMPVEKSKEFHGVFYGFLPCNNCNGIKATLSLKQNNHYLLVTQPAKESSREFFEKGKYSWDDENQAVILTPRDTELSKREYRIKDEGTIVQLDDDGKPMTGDDAEKYTLRRSDTVKSREVHIH